MSKLAKGLFEIKGNQAVAPGCYLLSLEGDASAVAASGQFVQLALPGRYLRRPISICDYDARHLLLLYKVVGAGTDQLSEMKVGEQIEVISGLGNGFCPENTAQKALLVGGGMGVAPLYRLAKDLLAAGKAVHVILGFNTAAEVCLETEFKALGVDVTISTADGSKGVKGFVTDAIQTLPQDYDYFYTCGPMVMMKAVCQLCPTEGEASLEERMGCGFGICYGCTIKTAKGAKRVCADGPVFAKGDLLW
ncbi:MAG: dihydroorotate dehydrogenase electron transfer subunit [Bacteroidales bacterium]|nr:dihydroorotate dehydrogenase electron transfer subunit [Bacteroidales bacterium]